MLCQQLIDTLCVQLLVNECLNTLETRGPKSFKKTSSKAAIPGTGACWWLAESATSKSAAYRARC